jgi:hypothetical protein
MKGSIFWDITPYSPFKVRGRLGGTCLHFRVEEKAKQETSMKQAATKIVLAACFMLVSCFTYPYSEDGSNMFFRNVG